MPGARAGREREPSDRGVRDAMALAFLASTWPIIRRAYGSLTDQFAAREDESRSAANALLLGASVASLVGVAVILGLAGRTTGPMRVVLIGVAVLTVVLSWALVNTVYTLPYAYQQFGPVAGGIAFGDSAGQQPPNYRDVAYVAFTIVMTYQVSDTSLRDPRTRRAVLSHASCRTCSAS
jgi:uncharacterized membrane protein